MTHCFKCIIKTILSLSSMMVHYLLFEILIILSHIHKSHTDICEHTFMHTGSAHAKNTEREKKDIIKLCEGLPSWLDRDCSTVSEFAEAANALVCACMHVYMYVA
jgi:hypothetical protein